MKVSQGKLNASPHKRLYHSIIADYTPELSVLELIDNAIDNGQVNKLKKVIIELEFDDIQNTIIIKDNSGGINKKDLKNIVSPGTTGNSGDEENIGIFGVGSKRGVISLAQKIEIKTRFKNEETFLVEYDDNWVGTDETWDIEYFQVDNIDEGTTIVELSKLRGILVSERFNDIKDRLGRIYGKIIDLGKVEIIVNKEIVKPILLENNWSFAKDYEPVKLVKELDFEGQVLRCEIFAGLSKHSSPQGKYGVSFYGNNRLICEYIRDDDVGYGKGKAGNAHPMKSLCNVIVKFNGPSKLIPWTSSKSGINFQSSIYLCIKEEIENSVIQFSKASEYLSKQTGSWKVNVTPFISGTIKVIKIDPLKKLKSYTLPIGKIRKSKIEKCITDNEVILKDKPWTVGLLESILATELILGKNFSQKNRIAFILLDSNLEIALKEYLVNEAKIGNKVFNNIKENRVDVIKEVIKHLPNISKELASTNYYYNIRNNFIHNKATATVNDNELSNYMKLVYDILNKLFGLTF